MIDYSPFPAYTLPITTLFVDIGGVLLTNGCGLRANWQLPPSPWIGPK